MCNSILKVSLVGGYVADVGSGQADTILTWFSARYKFVTCLLVDNVQISRISCGNSKRLLWTRQGLTCFDSVPCALRVSFVELVDISDWECVLTVDLPLESQWKRCNHHCQRQSTIVSYAASTRVRLQFLARRHHIITLMFHDVISARRSMTSAHCS